ncbi:MAG TPA: hypothetical protein VFU10_03260 [Gaiellaceae bacterium]|nr:hypothetical protein [Gaiellaceae bacterium]
MERARVEETRLTRAAPEPSELLRTPQATVLAWQTSYGNAAVCRTLGRRVLARQTEADRKIDETEEKKLPIAELLTWCDGIPATLRDEMITKIGAHAGWISEERQLACLLAVKFKGVLKRGDFNNTYWPLLQRLPADQRELVLGWVGPAAEGEAVNKAGVKKPNVKATASMRGAPGDSLVVDGITYVFTAEGIQFKESKSVGGGPAARNNNPGNITVDNFQPYAWQPDIGAYPGRNTDGRFAIFPTLAAGKKGAIAWARRFGGSKSIQDYFEGYAPRSEPGNDPDKYVTTVLAHVKAETGKTFTTTSTVAEILAVGAGAEKGFIEGHIEAEGFSMTGIKCVPRDSAELPKAVRDYAQGFDKAVEGTRKVAEEVAPIPKP